MADAHSSGPARLISVRMPSTWRSPAGKSRICFRTGNSKPLMPEVSRFYGISIYLYPRDHPPAHFYAFYGEHETVFDIATLRLMEGSFPNRLALWCSIGRRSTTTNFS